MAFKFLRKSVRLTWKATRQKKAAARKRRKAKRLVTAADLLEKRSKAGLVRAESLAKVKGKPKPGKSKAKGKVTGLTAANAPSFVSFLRVMDKNIGGRYWKVPGKYKMRTVNAALKDRLKRLGVTDPSKWIASIGKNLKAGRTFAEIANSIEAEFSKGKS